MICKNCGTDNITAEAVSCGDCGQPLNAGNVDVAACQESGFHDSVKDTAPSNDIDNDKLDISDPIDFIMNSREEDPGRETGPDEPSRADSSEREPVVITGNDFDMLKIETESGSSSKLNSPVQSEPEKPELSSPMITGYDATATVGVRTAASELRGNSDGTATKKIKVKDEPNKYAHSVSISQPSTEKMPAVDMPRVAKSRGIVLLAGDHLVFTGNVRIFPGDEVRIGDQLFMVRHHPKSRKKILGVFAAIIIISATIFAYFNGYIPLANGRLIGAVMGSSNNRHLSNAVVRLVEKNMSVTTDQAGFFMFDNLESGLYTIQLLENGEPVSEERIAVINNKTITITIFESKPISYIPAETVPPPEAADSFS